MDFVYRKVPKSQRTFGLYVDGVTVPVCRRTETMTGSVSR